MREAALLNLEHEPIFDTEDDEQAAGPLMTDAEFDRELELAAAGDWDQALDLPTGAFRPATIQEFMTDDPPGT